MSYRFHNPNPSGILVGDCVIRAISTVLDKSWCDTYIDLMLKGYTMSDMPSSNSVWGAFLKSQGFKRAIVPEICPDCYSIKDFTKEHSTGRYLLSTGTHVVAIINGDYYDTWDSGNEIPIFYWYKEE